MVKLLACLVFLMVWTPMLPYLYFVYHVFLSRSGALGHGGSRAAEYLKEHLFENLLKHPEFLTDTKLAISTSFFLIRLHFRLFLLPFLLLLQMTWNLCLKTGETYQKTDTDFLESESSAFRDDGSTASTAVLVGDHLYVANVGDSRAVISKAGKGIAYWK